MSKTVKKLKKLNNFKQKKNEFFSWTIDKMIQLNNIHSVVSND